MKIAILTTQGTWFVEYALELEQQVRTLDYEVTLFFEHEAIDSTYDIVFVLSYHRIIAQEYLQRHRHNLVVHASALPKGKGWAPFFWQVIEGKSEIPFTLFEAGEDVDNGDIYLQRYVHLSGFELYEELRAIQAQTTIEMCLDFLRTYDTIMPEPQIGEESFYEKRTAKDSELDIERPLKEQFNVLRTVNNESFPAFFEINGRRYILKIEHDTRGELP